MDDNQRVSFFAECAIKAHPVHNIQVANGVLGSRTTCEICKIYFDLASFHVVVNQVYKAIESAKNNHVPLVTPFTLSHVSYRLLLV